MQIGAELEGSPGTFSRPLATDTSANGWARPVGRGGVDVRGHWVLGTVAVEPFTEIEASGLRWYHRDTIVETVTTFGPEGDTVVTTPRDNAELRRTTYLTARTGFGIAWGDAGSWQVRAGAYVANAPWLYGRWKDHWGCMAYSDGSADCTTPNRPPDEVATVPVGGIYGAVSAPLSSRWVLNAGGWVAVDQTGPGDTVNAQPGLTLSLEFLAGSPLTEPLD